MATHSDILIREDERRCYWLHAYSNGCTKNAHKDLATLPEWIAERCIAELNNDHKTNVIGPYWFQIWVRGKGKGYQEFQRAWQCDFGVNAPRSTAFDIAHLMIQRHWMRWHIIEEKNAPWHQVGEDPDIVVDCSPGAEKYEITNNVSNTSSVVEFESAIFDCVWDKAKKLDQKTSKDFPAS